MATYYIVGNDSLTTQSPSGNGTILNPATSWQNLPTLSANDIVLYKGVFRTRNREWVVNAQNVTLMPNSTAMFNPKVPHVILTSSEPTPISGWNAVDPDNKIFSTNIGTNLSLNDVTFRYYDIYRFLTYSKGGKSWETLAPKAHLLRSNTASPLNDNSWHYDSQTGVLTVRSSLLAASGPSSYTVGFAENSSFTFPEIEYCLNVSANQVVLNGNNITLKGGMHIDRCGPRQNAANYNIQVTAGTDVYISDVVAKDASYHNIGASGGGVSSRLKVVNCYGITVAATSAGVGTNFVHFSAYGDIEDCSYVNCTAFACYPLNVNGNVFQDVQSPTFYGSVYGFYSHTANGSSVIRSKYYNCTTHLGWSITSNANSECCSQSIKSGDTMESGMIESDPNTYPLMLVDCKEIAVPYSAIGTPGSGSNGTSYSFSATSSTYIKGGVFDYNQPTGPNKLGPYSTGKIGFSTFSGPGLTMVIDGATILDNTQTYTYPNFNAVFSSVNFRMNDYNIGSNTIQNWTVSGDGTSRPLPNKLKIYNCIVQDMRPDPGFSGCHFIVSMIGACCDVKNNIFIRQNAATAPNQLTAVTLIGANYTLNSNNPTSLTQGAIDCKDNLWVGWNAVTPCWLRAGDWQNPGANTSRNNKASFFKTSIPLGVQRDTYPLCIDAFSSTDFPDMGSHELTISGIAANMIPAKYVK